MYRASFSIVVWILTPLARRVISRIRRLNLYQVALKREWIFEKVIPTPKTLKKLPVILSPRKSWTFLPTSLFKHRTILTTCYAASLRIEEVVLCKFPTSTASAWLFV